MKLKKILFTFILFTLSLNLFSRTAIKEISAGGLHLKFAYYTPIGAKSYVGANVSAGLFTFMIPIAELAPTYKYYFTPEKNTGFFVSTEIFAQIKLLPTPEITKVTNLGLGAGIGYKVHFGKQNKFFFRPTLNIRVPVYSHGGYQNYIGELIDTSLFKTVMNTLSIGYRF